MIFTSFSQPCEVTDVIINVLPGVTIVVGVDMLVDVETIVVTTAAIALEFAETVSYDADVLGDIRADVIIGVVADTGTDVLADVITALEFVLPSLLEESKPFC